MQEQQALDRWQAVASVAELNRKRVLGVRLAGEEVVLFRDLSGTIGLVGPRCPHQGVSLRWGYPETTGIGCVSHGWVFDASGICLEITTGPADDALRERMSILSYPVAELGGLVWGYGGPPPAPALPPIETLLAGDPAAAALLRRQ